MDLKTYQAEALKTALPTALNLDYLLPGLIAEVGECFGKVAKARRDEWDDDRLNAELVSEWGDVAWFVVVALHVTDDATEPVSLSGFEDRDDAMRWLLTGLPEVLEDRDNPTDLFYDLQDAWRTLRMGSEVVTGQPFDVVLEANLAKLKDRANRGKIGGSGDVR